jgi:glutamyl-tRNA reductase
VERLKIIAFTHKTVGVGELSKFNFDEQTLHQKLAQLKKNLPINELMILSTCNRYEFIMATNVDISKQFIADFFSTYFSGNENLTNWAVYNAIVMQGEAALLHLFNVASSVDSLVVGEREIITQVRGAYEDYSKQNFTGDFIRMVINKTIEAAKDVYTQTNIARNPVSIVSLAYRKLKSLNVKTDARFLIIGAGVTNTAMCKYLKKHGFKNFVVFNRTLSNAEILAADLNANAHTLADLKNYQLGFDVMVTCTGAPHAIINPEIYTSLTGNDKTKKIVIDLAVPNDLDAAITENYDVNIIAVNNLQEIATENLREREKELAQCEKILSAKAEEFKLLLKERKVELAMSEVPRKVKEIREIAVNEIFAKEIEQLDAPSKETLEKIIAYLEKKYISVPMKMAKEILIEETANR